ncbi:insulinase family protein [Amycolatopsis acidicola]|uniref:insulinase family protein n=1 Tax=Amycolatopsis acidicola TaxID=2596893 RepID=UPI001FB5C6FF|nr:insulinase family protein [Amycolatopsis acidicola]
MSEIVARSSVPQLPAVHRTEVDGIPAFWNTQPGRLSASLIFGVGTAHETFLETGVTHLVEHLAMHPLRTSRYDNGSATEMLHTSFEVTSGAATVSDHLRRICTSLSQLDTGPLVTERGALVAEERASDGLGVTTWLPSSIWFGNQSFGLAGNVQVAPVRATAEQIRAWGARWFHRGNAALVLSGPPPADLWLPLPEGPPRQPPSFGPFELPTPAQTVIPNGVVACALVGWTAEMACAVGVLISRLTDRLRQLDGLDCEIGFDQQRIDEHRTVLGFGADVPDKHAGKVVEAIRAELHGLGENGPTPQELAADREGLAVQLGEGEFAQYCAFDEALSALTGWTSAAKHQNQILDGLDASEVAAAARELAGKLVLCAPLGHVPEDLPELPGSPLPPTSGRELKRALIGSTVPRGFRIVVGDEGVSAFYGNSTVPVAVVRYDDAAGVGIEHTDGRLPILHLFGRHGGLITVRPGDWRGGRDLVRELRARFDPAVCFDAPDAMRQFEQS